MNVKQVSFTGHLSATFRHAPRSSALCGALHRDEPNGGVTVRFKARKKTNRFYGDENKTRTIFEVSQIAITEFMIENSKLQQRRVQ
jgi:hypothetical protein